MILAWCSITNNFLKQMQYGNTCLSLNSFIHSSNIYPFMFILNEVYNPRWSFLDVPSQTMVKNMQYGNNCLSLISFTSNIKYLVHLMSIEKESWNKWKLIIKMFRLDRRENFISWIYSKYRIKFKDLQSRIDRHRSVKLEIDWCCLLYIRFAPP